MWFLEEAPDQPRASCDVCGAFDGLHWPGCPAARGASAEPGDQVLNFRCRAQLADTGRAGRLGALGAYRLSYVVSDTCGETVELFGTIWDAIDAVAFYVPVGATFRVDRLVAGEPESVTVIQAVRSSTRPSHIDALPVS